MGLWLSARGDSRCRHNDAHSTALPVRAQVLAYELTTPHPQFVATPLNLITFVAKPNKYDLRNSLNKYNHGRLCASNSKDKTTKHGVSENKQLMSRRALLHPGYLRAGKRYGTTSTASISTSTSTRRSRHGRSLPRPFTHPAKVHQTTLHLHTSPAHRARQVVRLVPT